MKVVGVPDQMAALRPGAVRRLFGPPPNDPTGEVQPVEVLVDMLTDFGPCIRAYALLEQEDIELAAAGGVGVVELSMWGDHLHPFGVQFFGVARPCEEAVATLLTSGDDVDQLDRAAVRRCADGAAELAGMLNAEDARAWPVAVALAEALRVIGGPSQPDDYPPHDARNDAAAREV